MLYKRCQPVEMISFPMIILAVLGIFFGCLGARDRNLKYSREFCVKIIQILRAIFSAFDVYGDTEYTPIPLCPILPKSMTITRFASLI